VKAPGTFLRIIYHSHRIAEDTVWMLTQRRDPRTKCDIDAVGLSGYTPQALGSSGPSDNTEGSLGIVTIGECEQGSGQDQNSI
jgi:hypothetical protein